MTDIDAGPHEEACRVRRRVAASVRIPVPSVPRMGIGEGVR